MKPVWRGGAALAVVLETEGEAGGAERQQQGEHQHRLVRPGPAHQSRDLNPDRYTTPRAMRQY